MTIVVVLAILGVIGAVCARLAALWWARQPLGAVRVAGHVELRVGARRLDAMGRCGDSGQLEITDGRLEVTVGDRTILSVPIADAGAALCADPRPSLRLTGDGWVVSLVVDRQRPVPVAIGRIGVLRQTTTAQVVIDALRKMAAQAAEV